jgi:hypothetical protein
MALANLAGKFDALFVVGGMALRPSRITAHFGLNEIPECTIELPLGVTVQNGIVVAGPGNASLSVPPYSYASVVVGLNAQLVTGAGLAFSGLLSSSAKVFEGFVYSIAVNTAIDEGSIYATAQIKIRHWLSALAMTSMLSASTHASTPSQFLNPPAFSAMASGLAGAFSDAANTSLSVINPYVSLNPLVISNDIWSAGMHNFGMGLKGILNLFTNINTFNLLASGIPVAGGPPNSPAAAALAFIEPRPDTGYVIGRPLGLASVFASTPTGFAASARLVEELSKASLADFANTTFWNLLVSNWLPYLSLQIAPLVTRAVVMPVNTMVSIPAKTINASEYYSASVDLGISEPIKGMIIIGDALQSLAGGIDLQNDRSASPAVPGILGGFIHPFINGMVVFSQAPSWLQGTVNYAYYARQALGMMAADAFAVGNVFSPNIPPEWLPDPRMDIYNMGSRLMSVLAQAEWIIRMTSGRTMTVVTPFRLDIGPGTVIAVQLLPGTSHYIIGTVKSVFLDLSPENATTTYVLAGIKHSSEVGIGLGMPANPFWPNSTIYYTPLI